MCLFHPHFLDVYILPILTIFIFPYSPKKYFNSSSDISGHSPLVTNKLVFFLYDFIRCSFDIHMHSRSSFPGVIFLPQVFYAFYFSLLYYCLGYLFTSCVYIHFILYYILCVYTIFILVMLVLLLLSKPFLYCLFSHVNLVLVNLSSSFLSLCSNLVSFQIYNINDSFGFPIFYFMFFRSTSTAQFLFILRQGSNCLVLLRLLSSLSNV